MASQRWIWGISTLALISLGFYFFLWNDSRTGPESEIQQTKSLTTDIAQAISNNNKFPVPSNSVREAIPLTPQSANSTSPDANKQKPEDNAEKSNLATLTVHTVLNESKAAMSAQFTLRIHSLEDRDKLLFEKNLFTDSSGETQIEIPLGKVKAYAWLQGQISDHSEARITEPGKNYELTLSLLPAGVVEGIVLDAETKIPIAGASVFIDGFENVRTETQSDGRFRFENWLADGAGRRLSASAPGYKDAFALIFMGSKQHWSIDSDGNSMKERTGQGLCYGVTILLPAATNLEGQVFSPDGKPIADLLVSAEGYFAMMHGAASPDSAETVTDPQGRFHLPPLRANISHLLLIKSKEFADWHRRISAGDAGIRDLGPIYLEHPANIRGELLDDRGLPVEGFTLQLMPAEKPPFFLSSKSPQSKILEASSSGEDIMIGSTAQETESDIQGKFEFRNLQAETFFLNVKRNYRVIYSQNLELRPGLTQEIQIRLPDAPAISGELFFPKEIDLTHAKLCLSFGNSRHCISISPSRRFRFPALEEGHDYLLRLEWDALPMKEPLFLGYFKGGQEGLSIDAKR